VDRRAPLLRVLDALVSQPWIWDQVQRAYGLETDERWLRSRVADLTTDDLVLDVGAGTGTWRRVLPEGVRYIWLDTDRRKLARFRRRYPHEGAAVLADAARLPFADKSVDAALVVGMAHHLADEAFGAALRELSRVLRVKLVFLDVVRAPAPGLIDEALWALDQGAYARAPEDVLAAIARSFQLEEVDRYKYRFHYIGCTARPKTPMPGSVALVDPPAAFGGSP
jgi:ubiquinone/menaquinone biosynthesis C-methylase UbiE